MKYQWFQVNYVMIHKCLNEIFSLGQDVPLGRKPALIGRDLCQLLPVRAKPVFTFNDTETKEGLVSMDLWRKFGLAELDQVCQDDEMFVNMLKKYGLMKLIRM